MWWKEAGPWALIVALLVMAFVLGLTQTKTVNPIDAYCHGAAEGAAILFRDNFGALPDLPLRLEYEKACKNKIFQGTWLEMDLQGPLIPK